MNRTLHLSSLSLGVLAFLSLVGSPARAQVTGPTPVAGTTQQIGAMSGATQTAPALWQTDAVWTNLSGSNFDIYFVDTATTNAPINLTNTPNENEFLEDIDSGYVVWTHTSASSAGDVVLYEIASATPTDVAAATSTVSFSHPSVGGHYVVYERITSQYDIDIYDINTFSSPGQVTNDAAAQHVPRVSGETVVYEDYNADAANPEVFAYNVATSGPATRIAGAPARTPDIDGNFVVYVGSDVAGSDQVYLYDLTLKTTTTLSTVASHKQNPRISGTHVLWSDDRNAQGWDVYSYDLTAQSENLLAGGAGDQYLADIDGDRAMYTSNASGAEQVFLFTYATGGGGGSGGTGGGGGGGSGGGGGGGGSGGSGGGGSGGGGGGGSGGGGGGGSGGGGGGGSGGGGGGGSGGGGGGGGGGSGGGGGGGNVPAGCDPALTDVVEGPVVMSEKGKWPAFSHGQFKSDDKRKYFMCVTNGKVDGSLRTSHLLAAVDDALVLSPSAFKSSSNPPRFVAAPLSFDRCDRDYDRGHDHHDRDAHERCCRDRDRDGRKWEAAIFDGAATVSITIRVAK